MAKTPKHISAYFKKVGQKGGKASSAKRTPNERKALGKLGGTTRWKNHEYSQAPAAQYQRERRKKMKEAKETDDRGNE